LEAGSFCSGIVLVWKSLFEMMLGIGLISVANKFGLGDYGWLHQLVVKFVLWLRFGMVMAEAYNQKIK
jgi:hypothetical protein